MTADGLCRRVAETVFVRWKLEWGPCDQSRRARKKNPDQIALF